LDVPTQSLSGKIQQHIQQSPFSKSLEPLVDDFMDAKSSVLNDLWKFSVSLDIPHQLLCDSYFLQRKVNQFAPMDQKDG